MEMGELGANRLGWLAIPTVYFGLGILREITRMLPRYSEVIRVLAGGLNLGQEESHLDQIYWPLGLVKGESD